MMVVVMPGRGGGEEGDKLGGRGEREGRRGEGGTYGVLVCQDFVEPPTRGTELLAGPR